MADFDDDTKLGKGKDKRDTLSNLIAVFQNEDLDFSKNRAADDDLIGDAYEYLMKNFATESGKSKGQFYTPAEVSRVMAKVIGLNRAKNGKRTTIYDPTCGSGSLLLRAMCETPEGATVYGQEKDNTTAGLAKMNLVLHNKATGEIYAGNTFSDPHYTEEKDDSVLKRFDFAVAIIWSINNISSLSIYKGTLGMIACQPILRNQAVCQGRFCVHFNLDRRLGF